MTLRNAQPLTALAAFLLAFCGPSAACGAPILTNGDFETAGTGTADGAGRQSYTVASNANAITGWTLTGAGDVYLHQSPEIGTAIGSTFNSAQSGVKYLDLSGGIGGGTSGQHATIYQDFATTPATQYELKFYIGAAFSPSATINVQLDGTTSLLNQTLTASAPTDGIVWTEKSFVFVANSPTTRLSFKDTSGSDDNVSFVDNVSINAVSTSTVPEPGTMLVGCVTIVTFGLFNLRRRARVELSRV